MPDSELLAPLLLDSYHNRVPFFLFFRWIQDRLAVRKKVLGPSATALSSQFETYGPRHRGEVAVRGIKPFQGSGKAEVPRYWAAIEKGRCAWYRHLG